MRKEIEDIRIGPGMTAGEIISRLGKSGVFGAGRVNKAVDIIQKMLDANAKIYLGLSGAMVPAGMRRVIADMISDGMVDVLVSTGANITHDLMRSFGLAQWRELSYSNDAELKEKGIARIHNSFIEEEAFGAFEQRLTPLIAECLSDMDTSSITPSELLHRIGSRLEDEASIVYNAAKRGIPIFVPAFTDSILGMQSFFYSKSHPLAIDVLGDLGKIMDISFQAKISGAILIGGGVPKNFILQSKLVAPTGFNYAVQITTDRPEPGGLSGATLDEAISWGKVDGKSETVTIYGDATIILPIVVAAVKERLGDHTPPKEGRR